MGGNGANGGKAGPGGNGGNGGVLTVTIAKPQTFKDLILAKKVIVRNLGGDAGPSGRVDITAEPDLARQRRMERMEFPVTITQMEFLARKAVL
jgi:hypothetical protein